MEREGKSSVESDRRTGRGHGTHRRRPTQTSQRVVKDALHRLSRARAEGVLRGKGLSTVAYTRQVLHDRAREKMEIPER